MSASIARDHLEVADALAELAALARVGRGDLERALGDPDGLGGDARAAAFERAHREREPSPSSPIRFAAGTRTPSKASSAVGLPRIPILCSMRVTLKPVGRDLDDEARQALGARRLRVGDARRP